MWLNVPLVIVENGVRLRLNIVDTPGYGDNVNNENWCVRPPSTDFPSSLYTCKHRSDVSPGFLFVSTAGTRS